MIPFNVPTPLSSFLEAYDRAKGALRDAGHLDTNFTVHDTNGNLIDLKTVQQGGDFLIEPGSAVMSNPPQAYAFARYKNERPDPRGNYYPSLTPSYISPSMVADMYEQHGAFQATCNIISALNTKTQTTSLPHTGIMRARIIDTQSIQPDSTYVRSNPRPIVARPAQILAGQESVFDAEIDTRLKEYFNEEGYGIDPYTETSIGPDGEPRVSYFMSDTDQFYDNHKLSSKYQANTELFYRFCNYVLSPYLVHSATVDNFINHINSEVIPSLNRLADEGRNVGLGETPKGGMGRKGTAQLQKRYSHQLRYMLQRLATDAKDFYFGKDMALMVHPVFLIPHMQHVILPVPHMELQAIGPRNMRDSRRRRNYITRAERLLNEAGEPPQYSNSGQRNIPRYSESQGGDGAALVPLHHLAAVGPGTAAFSWGYLQQRIQQMDIPGILEALFRPLEADDEIGDITGHRVEDYVEAARRLYGRARTRRDSLNQGRQNYNLIREHTPWAGTRQTGEMMRIPYMGGYTEAELNGMSRKDLVDLGANMLGRQFAPKTKALAIVDILQYQTANPNHRPGGLMHDDAHTIIQAQTPIVFEIDLPGLHPLPVGWPEELVFSMMETLSKYREQIAGLNGQAFAREEFMSPSINSNFRFDEDASIELSWYDPTGNRQRRFGVSYSDLRKVTDYAPNDHATNQKKAASFGKIAYALIAIGDAWWKESFKDKRPHLIALVDLFIKRGKEGKLTGAERKTYEDAMVQVKDLCTGLIGANKLEFFDDGGKDNAVHSMNRIRLLQALVMSGYSDYFQYASENGQGMVNLKVDVTNGLSSMFILRETLKQARTKYNYIASADDTTFIYHLMVWCLENCLGSKSQVQSEKMDIGKFFQSMYTGLIDRREVNVAGALNAAVIAANVDEAQQLLLIELLLEGL